MTPCKQLFRHDPPDSYGDCLRACYAALFDEPAEAVPHFYDDGVVDEGVEAEDRWLDDQGIQIIHYRFAENAKMSRILEYMDKMLPSWHWLLIGATASGNNHVAVFKGGQLACDPSPDAEPGQTVIAGPGLGRDDRKGWWVCIPVRRSGFF